MSFYGFASENPLCEAEFQKNTSSPLNPSSLAAIRNRLEVRQNIGGATTLNMKQPFSAKTAEKLHKFLLLQSTPYLREIYIVPVYLSDELFEKYTASAYFKDTLLQSRYFSPDEVNEITQGLNQYIEQIKQLVFQMDSKEVLLTDITIRTEEGLPPVTHNHKLRYVMPFWVSATHALIGSGSWYETTYNKEKEIAVAKTGETLLLSEPYRSNTLSEVQRDVSTLGAMHGSSPGKRLVIVVFFELKSNSAFMEESEK